MKPAFAAAAALALLTVAPAIAEDYIEFPAPEAYPFRRSTVAPRLVAVPPYRRPFVLRTYTTPPRQPYYNVPPYTVIAPY